MGSGVTPPTHSAYTGALIALFLLIALMRWPLLTSPDLVLDGDEAIVGLIAQDLAEGRRVPLYFAGQSFGISIVETAAIAAAFRVAGVSTVAVKVAVLALWILGWALFADAVRRWVDRPTALVAAALLATMPAWGNWSMMARGYHLGGFVTAQACFWWLARTRSVGSNESVRMIVTGALLALLGLTQLLWLATVLPFAALVLVEWRRRRDLIELAIGAGALVLLGLAARFGQSASWSPPYLGRSISSAPRLECRASFGRASAGPTTTRNVCQRVWPRSPPRRSGLLRPLSH